MRKAGIAGLFFGNGTLTSDIASITAFRGRVVQYLENH
jgi:hypothetical protein